MSEQNWQPISSYPDKGRRDENGKWTDEPGPLIELLFANGLIVKAQWYGARTKGGGEAWAWWEDGSSVPIGYYEPEAFRLREPPSNDDGTQPARAQVPA